MARKDINSIVRLGNEERIQDNFIELYAYAGNVAGVTFANLPTAAAGKLAYITDSNTVTWGATVAGGGANPVLAWYNGTNWTVVGA